MIAILGNVALAAFIGCAVMILVAVFLDWAGHPLASIYTSIACGFVAFIVSVFALFLVAPAAGHDLETTTYRVTVTRVIDADTFEGVRHFDGGLQAVQPGTVRVRLDCIQAAERYTPDGAFLTELVTSWIEGRDVFISHVEDGGFGRLLARVHVPGWSETLSQRLYRYEAAPSPLYTGSQTNRSAIEACRRRMSP